MASQRNLDCPDVPEASRLAALPVTILLVLCLVSIASRAWLLLR